MQIIERVAGRYDVQSVEFGKVYRWSPETVLVKCKCGKRVIFKRQDIIGGSVSSCECGKDHMDSPQEELVLEAFDEDEAIHPWRYWRSAEVVGIPF